MMSYETRPILSDGDHQVERQLLEGAPGVFGATESEKHQAPDVTKLHAWIGELTMAAVGPKPAGPPRGQTRRRAAAMQNIAL
jgi:hypothetical protein